MLALTCIAMVVYFEARSEPILGQIAVARVVLNRAADNRYPGDPCAVVTQGPTTATGAPRKHRCHFSFYCDGLDETPHEHAAWQQAFVVAALAYVAEPFLPLDLREVTHYHSVDVRPYWSADLTPVAQIGSHLFYSGVR